MVDNHARTRAYAPTRRAIFTAEARLYTDIFMSAKRATVTRSQTPLDRRPAPCRVLPYPDAHLILRTTPTISRKHYHAPKMERHPSAPHRTATEKDHCHRLRPPYTTAIVARRAQPLESAHNDHVPYTITGVHRNPTSCRPSGPAHEAPHRPDAHSATGIPSVSCTEVVQHHVRMHPRHVTRITSVRANNN